MKKGQTVSWWLFSLLLLYGCGPRIERVRDEEGRILREIRQEKGHWLITTFYPDGKVRHLIDRHQGGETVRFFDEAGKRIGEDLKVNGDPVLLTMKRWFPDGKPRSESEYRDGQRFGLWREWYPSGTLRSEVAYQADRYEGKRHEYSEEGVLLLEGFYHRGLEEGVWVYRSPEGEVHTRIPFRQGRREGAEEQFYPGGRLKLRARYREGKPEGLWEEWFANGRPSLRARYREGKPEGLWEEWFDDGSPDFRLEYREGEPWSGNRVFYTEDGRPEREEFWRSGRLQRTRTFPAPQAAP